MDTHGVDVLPALVQVYGALPDGARLTQLAGDASTRTYYRFECDAATPRSLILMHLPPDPLGSDEGGSGAVAELPFLSVQRLLAARGVPVPTIHAVDIPRRVVLLQDLGADTFFDVLHRSEPSQWSELYGRAVDVLARMHATCAKPEAHPVYERSFDRTLLRWEFDHFRQWGLEALGSKLSEDDRLALDTCFDALVEQLVTDPQGFAHRDYQSRNLMVQPDGSLIVIDFQDALQGPRTYDLVALLCDSYVELPLELQLQMVERYCEQADIAVDDRPAFVDAFWRVAVQRKLKDAGRFVFIDQVRGNPNFLQWFPRSIRYVGRALAQLGEYPTLVSALQRLVPGFPDDAAVPARQTGARADAHLR